MGYSRSTASDWDNYTRSTSSKSASAIFTARTSHDVDPGMLPINITMRESRDSAANPNSNAIILASDITGSMGIIAEQLIRKGLSTAFKEILERAKPDPKTGRIMMVTDPHMLCMGVGDAISDEAPIQVTQFEPTTDIAKQLEKVWIEGNGGGNGGESYNLAHYFAATRTSIDCFEKRKKKGYLFTIGDEPPHENLSRGAIKTLFGDDVQGDLSSADLVTMASRTYNVFHILLTKNKTSSYVSSAKPRWQKLVGQNLLMLDDHHKLGELIVSTIQVYEGMDVETVASTWSGGTDVVIRDTLGHLKPAGSAGTGVRRF